MKATARNRLLRVHKTAARLKAAIRALRREDVKAFPVATRLIMSACLHTAEALASKLDAVLAPKDA